MIRYALPFVLLVGASLLAVLFLQPSPAARLEGDVLGLGPEEALDRLRDARAAGDPPFTTDLDLLQARLEREARNWAAATRAFRAALDRLDAPEAAILFDLATTDLLSGDARAATEDLGRAMVSSPTPDLRRTLGRRLRHLGLDGDERDLLSSVPVDELDPGERRRLADLLFAAGDADRYEAFLSAAAALATADAVEARADLLARYVATERTSEARALATSWPGAETTGRLVSALLARGNAALASDIAADTVVRRPQDGAEIAMAFAGPDTAAAGLRPVVAWLSATDRLSDDDWTALVAFASRSGETSALHRAIRRFADAPTAAFEVLLRHEGAGGLQPYRDLIEADHGARAPLLAAGLAAGGGAGPQLLARLIEAADPALSQWDREIWTALARELSGTQWLADLLAQDLPPEFARRAADVAREGLRAPTAPAPEDRAD